MELIETTQYNVKALLIQSLIAVLASSLGMPAHAAKCPPEHKKADVRKPPSGEIWDGVSIAIDGITDKTIATVRIDKEPFNVDGRALRTRRLLMEPSTVVPWHSHDDRPATMHVIRGELTEYASN